MKNKLMILLAAIGLLAIVSCKTRKEVPPPPTEDIPAYTGPKLDVAGVRGILIAHPDTNSIKGKGGVQWFLLYDYDKKCLYMTENQQTYMEIVNWLPVKGIPTHYVRVEAPTIDPITLFDPAQLAEISKKLGIGLRKYRMAKIYNHNTLELNPGEVIINGNVVSADQQKIVSPGSTSNSTEGAVPKYRGTHHN